jgi:hypothetical protein
MSDIDICKDVHVSKSPTQKVKNQKGSFWSGKNMIYAYVRVIY